jgi:hypothetical protein
MAMPQVKLLAFDGSNGCNKRYDLETGVLIIVAGYRESPGPNVFADNENPVVATKGQNPRWYGANACLGAHTPVFGSNKIEAARASFAACLQPSDHGKNIKVVASHWETAGFDQLKTALLGKYSIVRNGEQIDCTVVEVGTILEGLGAYEIVKPKLKEGSTILLELGFGTAEVFLFSAQGKPLNMQVVDKLGVSTLVNDLAKDASVRSALLADGSGTPNRSFISQHLPEPTMGRIGSDNWAALKAKYGKKYLAKIAAFLRADWADEMQITVNVVLTGGGAALIQSVLPDQAARFIIPDQAHSASVRGAYALALAKAKGADK